MVGHAFTSTIIRYGAFEDIIATRDYPSGIAALDSNQRARSIVNTHKNEESRME